MNKIKSLSIVIMLFATSTLFAQTNNLRKAKANYTQFESLQQAGGGANKVSSKLLKDAATPIKEAIAHDRTKNNPETWVYYSLIYANMAYIDNNSSHAKAALEGIEKARELDKDGNFKQNLDNALAYVKGHYRQKGANEWERKNYKAAYNSFEEALKIDAQDTTLIYYSGVSAIQNKDYPNAITRFEQLVPQADFSDHRTVMLELPRLILHEGDTTKALEYASKASQMYPDDTDISAQNIDYHLKTGQEAKIISSIEAQIAKTPDNKSLHFYLGLALSSTDNISGAVEAYKKALEIDPNYTAASLNLAASIINGANQELMTLNENRNLPAAEYNKRSKEIRGKMAEAIPYLESIPSTDSNYETALRNLKVYYDYVADEAKSAEVQQKLDAIQ